jgi:hypothetical protein
MKKTQNYLVCLKFLVMFLFLQNSTEICASGIPKPKYKVLFPIPYTGGEGDMGVRLEIAARNIGWTAQSFFFANEWKWDRAFDFYRTSEPFSENCKNLLKMHDVITEFQPDFIVSLFPKLYTYPRYKIPHYLTLTRSHAYNIKHYGKRLLKFEGFLSVPQDHKCLYRFLEGNRNQNPIMNWVPTTLRTNYEPLQAKRLFYCATNWDPLRTSPDYFQCIKLLDQTGLVDIYGTQGIKIWNLKSYKGELPYDGRSFHEALKISGIALILHSQEHLEAGAITGRIFEAAAAGCVIISDRHKFIEKEFGDSVLYLDIDKDHKLSGEKMFEQITSHLIWVLNNPKEAEQKARKAHGIFDAKFTLEDQLERLGEFHENIYLNKYSNSSENKKLKFLQRKS